MERHDPQLFVCITDYTDFSSPNLFIDTQFFTYSFHLRKEIIASKRRTAYTVRPEFIRKP